MSAQNIDCGYSLEPPRRVRGGGLKPALLTQNLTPNSDVLQTANMFGPHSGHVPHQCDTSQFNTNNHKIL